MATLTNGGERERRVEGSVEWRGKACATPEHKHSRCSYRVRVENGVDPATGRRRFLYATGRGNAKAAETAVRELLNQRDAGLDAQPKKLTTGEWLSTWHKARMADAAVGPRTAENYVTIIEKRLKPAIGAIRLQDLRADHVVALKTAMVEEGRAPATIKTVLGLLRQALEAALVAGLIVRNPAQAVPRPSVAHVTERRALSEAEVGKLLAAAAGTPYDSAIRLALATGARQSELLGARWGDIDLDRGTFVVSQTLQHVAGEFRTLPPKTRNSKRMIELSAATVAMLRKHRAAQNAERLRLGSVWRDLDLVLPAPDGGPQYRRNFYGSYRELVKASGIERPEQVNFHTLRHTAASLWIKAGVDVFVVSRRLGHGSPSFTMAVYAHLLKGQQMAAAEALDHLLTVNA